MVVCLLCIISFIQYKLLFANYVSSQSFIMSLKDIFSLSVSFSANIPFRADCCRYCNHAKKTPSVLYTNYTGVSYFVIQCTLDTNYTHRCVISPQKPPIGDSVKNTFCSKIKHLNLNSEFD